MEYFAGLDVSLRSCAVCVVDNKGLVSYERELPCEIEEISAYLNALPHPIERIGFEPGTLSQHLYYGVTAKGFDVVCLEACQVSATLAAIRNKTDRNDARGIAQILRTGWFSPVHMKSRDAHGMRALLSTRKALLRKTIDLANEVGGFLKIFGIRLPKTVKHGSFDDVVRQMVPSSVRKIWRAWHDLTLQNTNLNGIVLTGRGSWMKPKMSAAPPKRVSKRGSPRPIRHMHAAVFRTTSIRLQREA